MQGNLAGIVAIRGNPAGIFKRGNPAGIFAIHDLVGSPGPLGPLGSSSSQHRRTPELVLWKDHTSFQFTSAPPVQRIAAEPAKDP